MKLYFPPSFHFYQKPPASTYISSYSCSFFAAIMLECPAKFPWKPLTDYMSTLLFLCMAICAVVASSKILVQHLEALVSEACYVYMYIKILMVVQIRFMRTIRSYFARQYYKVLTYLLISCCMHVMTAHKLVWLCVICTILHVITQVFCVCIQGMHINYG